MSYALPLGAARCHTRRPLAQDFVLRVAAFSQTWLARVAARAASARRCLVEQRFVFQLWVISSAWPFLVRLSFVLRGRQCCASVVAKAHLVGGGVRARVFRRDLREHPGAHYEMRARPWSDAIFANIHAFDIRCSRSVVLRPSVRTPAMVAQGTRARFVGEGDALRPMACPTRCRSAPFVVLRAPTWRRLLTYGSQLFRRHGLRT